MKKIYFVRHCSAQGQHKDSPLTYKGIEQAERLAKFFQNENILFDRIISSPYLRAIESIKPYAKEQKVKIEIDDRLKERILSEEPIDDWLEILEQTFENYDFKLSGGESSNEAVQRALELLHEIYYDEKHANIAVITHGNLLALILNHYDKQFGFRSWKELQNPDLFLLEFKDNFKSIKRLFDDEKIFIP